MCIYSGNSQNQALAKEQTMKRTIFVVLFIAMCVTLIADSGEEMLKRAISTNPTNNWSNGSKQKGQWSTGMGAYLYNTGTMYFGNFLDTNNHGYGIYIVPDGYYVKNCPDAKYYVGNWSNEKKSGKGTCYDKTGKLIYYGDFKDDKPTGTYPTTSASYKFQTIEYTSGDKYIGETKDGKRHGYGVCAWKDGGMWIGNWKDGERDGRGLYIAPSGSLTTGTWKGNTHTPDQTNVAAGRSSSGSSSQEAPSVTFVNNTDKTIRKIIFVYTEESPGVTFTMRDGHEISNLMRSGDTVTVKLPKPINERNKYDIELEFADGSTSKTSNVTVRANATLTLGTSSGSSVASGSSSSSSSSSSSGITPLTCSLCLGTGRCLPCNGTGRLFNSFCSICGGTGICKSCDGTGIFKYIPPPPPPPVVWDGVDRLGGSGSSGSSGGSYSGGGSSGSSSSSGGGSVDYDFPRMQRVYFDWADAAKAHLDNYRKNPTQKNLDEFRSVQRKMREYREECNRKGANMGADYYENYNP